MSFASLNDVRNTACVFSVTRLHN